MKWPFAKKKDDDFPDDADLPKTKVITPVITHRDSCRCRKCLGFSELRKELNDMHRSIREA